MSTLTIRTSDDPREGGRSDRQQPWAWSRLLLGAGLSLCLIGMLSTAAWAQAGRPPRVDPGSPPADPAGSTEGWQVLSIPGLPAGAVLGDIWAAPNGDIYVWANYPQRTGGAGLTDGDQGEGEGEKLPNPGGTSNARSSTLYHYNGVMWSTALVTPGETGVALFGTDPANIWVSTTSAQGEARLYYFNGTAWAPKTVPGYHLGKLHTMAGVQGDMYFRVDNVIMHDCGQGLQPCYEMPGDDAPARGLVYLDTNHLFMFCPDGYVLQTNGAYQDCNSGFMFGDVQDAWGMRDANGFLSMFVIGSSVWDDGVRVWRFNELDKVNHTGEWLCVLADPLTSGDLGIGRGIHLSGTAANDVYATGVVGTEGRMYRYDGLLWTRLLPPVAFGPLHQVSATPAGTVWFTAEAGQVIRYQRPNIVATEPAPVSAPVVAEPLQAAAVQGGVRIRYTLAEGTRVHLGVFDLAGRLCGTVEDGFQTAGTHEATWNQGGLQSGIYFVKLRAGSPSFSRRVVVLR